MEGNFPIGYRLARGYDRFAHQASGLAHVVIADAFHRRLPGIDWERAVDPDVQGFRPGLRRGLPAGWAGPSHHPHPRPRLRRLLHRDGCPGIGETDTADRMDDLAGRWLNAFDADGLLKDSTYLRRHEMELQLPAAARHGRPDRAGRRRRSLCRGRSIGSSVRRHRRSGSREKPHPGGDGCRAALGRFEGLNNEPDMEAPYAYLYAGRHDRTCEIVRAGTDPAATATRPGAWSATTTPAG